MGALTTPALLSQPPSRPPGEEGDGSDTGWRRGGDGGNCPGDPKAACGLITKTPKTGSQIQRDLCEQGFDDVVMFDGGRGFSYYRDGVKQPGTYGNLAGLTGLGVNPK